jgi:hypothetical protein
MKLKWVLLDSFVWVTFLIFECVTGLKNFFALKPATYQFSNWTYGRCLGGVTLIAFLSYWYQADALIAHNGLSHWSKDLKNIEQLVTQNQGLNKWSIRPTLLWFEPFSNHHLLFGTGTVSALLLTIGFLPTISALVSYLCYLSLMVVGEPFLSFQWDALLCETLLLSLPCLPFTKFHKFGTPYKVSIFARYLLIALLAKLMLESGIVKFTSFGADNANTWRDLTALDFHYWTQPLPHGLSPWIDSLPAWLDQFSLISMYGIELIFPILLFFPGNLRRIAVSGQIILQIAILLSGNYGFFNLLTLCLCIPLIDDQILPKSFLKYCKQLFNRKDVSDLRKNTNHETLVLSFLQTTFLCLAWFFFAVTSYGHLARDFKGNQVDPILEIDPSWTDEYMNIVRPTRAFNSYGLFRVMTTTRPEIIIEGSLDGKTWRPYEFKYKPTDPKQSPRFAGIHMPRIDWQMWFEGLNYERYSDHPFARMLYHKFLSNIALGESIDGFRDFEKLLGAKEYQSFIQSPPHVQQRVLQNYNSLLHAFQSRSLWFGELLEAIFGHRPEIMEHMGEKLEDLPPLPNYLRVSLSHYRFADEYEKFDPATVWNVKQIKEASFIISKK